MNYRQYIFGKRDGQTIIFLIMVLVILAFIAIWNFGLHKVGYVRLMTRNAGDGAALEMARWQGITLNVVGELNVAQAVAINNALMGGDPDAAAEIAALQGRLCYAGPMLGVAAAQQAARNNGVYASDQFTADMYQRARDLEGSPLLPPAYSEMLRCIGDQKVTASPMMINPGGHPLLMVSFYEAVASYDWCWFLDYGLLGWTEWPPLPNLSASSVYGALNLTTIDALIRLDNPIYTNQFTGSFAALTQLRNLSPVSLLDEIIIAPVRWYIYSKNKWDSWDNHLTPRFPFATPIKDEYNYFGADSVVCTEFIVTNLLFGAQNITNSITSAAKPLGHLNGPVSPAHYGIVLPAFHDVRLIPNGASSANGSECSSKKSEWERHIFNHVPRYVDSHYLEAGCSYCAYLALWETSEFQFWVQTNQVDCVRSGHGVGPGGGTSSGG